MACTLFALTPEEAVAGMTINAARALGLAHETGSIAAGKAADLCVWRIESLAELGVRHLRTGISWADFLRPGGKECLSGLHHEAIRLPNGHTLVATANLVVELDRNGNKIWQMTTEGYVRRVHRR